ncbi:MAG: EscU/YscU/HrcU family type III secretion system export apparatus switch protein [Chloroflexi bacterium]|nr:EscU/YscU/HrcU family type III secretion system export apparatus switch protein [Chloroflexota bacterium]
MTAGSALIASAFGLSAGLAKSKWLRMFVSGVGVTFALWLAWALHLSTDMSPILFYESAWSTAQVLGMALLTAAPIAILGNINELDSPSPGER